jgi:hypothetical protein
MRVLGRTLIICPCMLCMTFLLMVQVKAERKNEFRKDSRESIAPGAQRPSAASKTDGNLPTSRSFDRYDAGTGTANSVPGKKQVAGESNVQQVKWSSNSGSTGGEQKTRREASGKSSRSSVEPLALSRSGNQEKESGSDISATARRPTDSLPQSAKTHGDTLASDQQQHPRVLSSGVPRDSSLPTDASARPTRTGSHTSREH